jgi:ABC-type dipeptide/oligopeptide/nickel transport system permease subunit
VTTQRVLRASATLWVVGLVFLAATADLLPLAAPDRIDLSARGQPPTMSHPLGTDGLGRDLLSRTIHGTRVALWVGLAGPLIGLLSGGLLGILAGYFGGRLDRAARIAIDTLLAVPAIAIAMLFTTWFQGALGGVILALGLLACPFYARVARSESRTISQRAFIDAAHATGAGPAATLWRHVLPNVAPTLRDVFLLLAAVLVLLEGSLSYLGLSVRPPTPTWGGMIAHGRAMLDHQPHVALVPMAALVVTVMSLNVLGHAGDRARNISH